MSPSAAALVVFMSAAAVCPSLVSGLNRTRATIDDATAARFEFEQPHMGTTARVVFYAHDASMARRAADRAFARIAQIDARLSDYRSDSELTALCRAAGGPPVRVSDDLYAVLWAAERLAQRTNGAFDVTVGPLSRLWRRARVTGEPPDPASLAAARALVGHEHLDLNGNRSVRLTRPGMLLDLGGIAKGFAADAAVKRLAGDGVHHSLVAIGGDVRAGDAPPGKPGWSVAVAPLGPAAEATIPPVTLRQAALSTSGDAEQYIEHDGKRYSHIVTPHTGGAVEGRRGVTILAADGLTADSLATAVFVLDRDRGLALVDDTPGAAALIVERSAVGIRQYRSTRW